MNTTVQKRGPSAQSTHDAWVKAIARARFPFPSKEHPTWHTSINPGSEKNAKITTRNSEFYPDIVVLDSSKPSGNVVMIGEVETSESVAESEVPQWKEYSAVETFYLYVPKGSGTRARELTRGLKVTGLREYSVSDGKTLVQNV